MNYTVNANINANANGFSNGVRQAENGLTGLRSSASNATAAMQSGFSGASSSVSSFIKSAAGIAGITLGIQGLSDALTQASSKQSSLTGLNSILEGQGRNTASATAFLQSYIKDGLVPLTNATAAYKNLAARGYDDKQIQTVMTRLKDSASFNRQASLSMGDAVQTATEGLKNENSILVDNAGVTKNVAVMWKEYAAKIGTTSDKLTTAQKIQAETNGIINETKWQVGDAAKYSQTYAGKVSELQTELWNAKVTLGDALMPVMIAIMPHVSNLISGFSGLVTYLENMNQPAKILLGVALAAAVAIPAVTIATKAYALAQLLLSNVMGILIPETITFTTVLQASLGWIGVIAGAIGILAAIFGGTDSNAKKTSTSLSNTGQSANKAASGVKNLTDSTKSLNSETQKALAGFDEINKLGSKSGSGLLSGALSGATGNVDLSGLTSGIKSGLTKANNTWADGWQTFVTHIRKAVKDFQKGDWADAWGEIEKAVDPVRKWFDHSFNGFGTAWSKFWHGVGAAVYDATHGDWKSFWNDLDSGIEPIRKWFRSSFGTFGKTWDTWWSQVGACVYDATHGDWKSFWNDLDSGIEPVRKWFRSSFGTFGKTWDTWWSQVGACVYDATHGDWKSFWSDYAKGQAAVDAFIDKSFLGGFFKAWRNALKEIAKNIAAFPKWWQDTWKKVQTVNVAASYAALGVLAGPIAGQLAKSQSTASSKTASGKTTKPHYATGAILPANHPIDAVVGDNTTQAEVVSPLGDLFDMMLGAIAASGANGDVNITLPVCLDGQQIYSIFKKYAKRDSRNSNKLTLDAS